MANRSSYCFAWFEDIILDSRFSIKHQTIEFPLLFTYKTNLNKNKNLTFVTGLSFIYLIKGSAFFSYQTYDFATSYSSPIYQHSYNYYLGEVRSENPYSSITINKFFPKYNTKLTCGVESAISKTISLGVEFNYFVLPIGKNFAFDYTNNNSINNIPKVKPQLNLTVLLILKIYK